MTPTAPTDPGQTLPVTTPAAPDSAPDAAPGAAPTVEAEEPSFWDFIDIINPLQHLPIIAPIYRAVTGDQISAPARIIGSAVFGGPIGMAGGLVNAVVERISGRDIGGHAIALVLGEESVPKTVYPGAGPDPSLLAEADETPAVQVAAAADLAFDGEDVMTGVEAAALAPSLLPFTTAAPRLETAAAEQPVWLGKAMTDARALNQAQETGQAFAPADTTWVTTAMMHALDKYQTMLSDRADARDTDDGADDRGDDAPAPAE